MKSAIHLVPLLGNLRISWTEFPEKGILQERKKASRIVLHSLFPFVDFTCHVILWHSPGHRFVVMEMILIFIK